MSKKKKSMVVNDEPVITSGMKQHMKYLIGLSVLSKIAVFIITVFVLGSNVDMFQIGYYYEHFVAIFHGDYPYINNYYEYPILSFIPVIIAWIPSVLFNSVLVYMITFVILLIIADCITTICVYLIARKIWNNSKIAFTSAFIYLTAISTMYFVLFDNSTFASCMLMVGLTLLFYGEEFLKDLKLNIYSSLVIGYFIKVFPIIALPFVILYQSRSTSLKQEIVSSLKVILPIFAILTIPIIIFNPSSILKTLLPARMDIGYFPETIIWTLYVWVHDIFHISISMDNVLVFVYVCMGISFLLLFYTAFKYKKQEPVMLLKFILCALMILVLAYKVRSPGYIIWFTPLMCILIADNIYKIGLFYIVQLLAYLEFPLTFWLLWTNVEYTSPIYSTNWYLTLLLFTMEFLLLIVLSWVTIEPIKIYKKVFKST